jgi:hypothetical protein
MTPHSSLLAAAVALLVVPAAASAADHAPYDIPADKALHETWTQTITGVPARAERHEQVEVWATRDAFRLERRNAGRLVAIEQSGPDGSIVRDVEDGVDYASADQRALPGPGFDPDRLRSYLAKGWLTPSGHETIAGVDGQVLEFGAAPEHDGISLEVVVEPGTLRPLRRTDTRPNGVFGTFFQQELLVSYALTPRAGATGVIARAAGRAVRRAR